MTPVVKISIILGAVGFAFVVTAIDVAATYFGRSVVIEVATDVMQERIALAEKCAAHGGQLTSDMCVIVKEDQSSETSHTRYHDQDWSGSAMASASAVSESWVTGRASSTGFTGGGWVEVNTSSKGSAFSGGGTTASGFAFSRD